MRTLVCGVVLLGVLLLSTLATAQYHHVNVVWRRNLNPTEGPDVLISACLGEGDLYVVYRSYSKELGSWVSRLDVWELSSGTLVAGPVVWEEVLWRSCTVLGKVLYLAGYRLVNESRVWVVAALSLDSLQELRRVEGVGGAPTHVTVYGGNLVVVGWCPEEGGVGEYWRVELRDLETLELLTYAESDPRPSKVDYPLFAAANPKTDHLWVFGEADGLWYVEVYDSSLRSVLAIDNIYLRRYALAAVFDEEGYAYVGGAWGLVKFSWNGTRVSMYTPRYTYFTSLALYGDYLVAAAFTYPRNVIYYLYVFDRDLNPLLIKTLDVAISYEAVKTLALPVLPYVYSLGGRLYVILTEYLGSGTTVEETDTVITLLSLAMREAEPTTVASTLPIPSPAVPPQPPTSYPSWLLAIASIGLVVALAIALLLVRGRRSVLTP